MAASTSAVRRRRLASETDLCGSRGTRVRLYVHSNMMPDTSISPIDRSHPLPLWAQVLAHVRGRLHNGDFAERFPTDATFARHSGTAPIPASSGNTTRHRLHRGGDRQLNRALHTIALSRARTDPLTRAYLDRRAAEGKTKLEALRCLKRHLARHFWKLLYRNPQIPQPT